MAKDLTPLELKAIGHEAGRAARFVSHCELAHDDAVRCGDAKFFARLAYQKAFLGQVSFIDGLPAVRAADLLWQALRDFLTALDFGYLTDADEVNNWFYRALLLNDFSAAHFLAALPVKWWWAGRVFARYQVSFGFSLLRGEEQRAAKVLEFLYGWCFESGSEPAESIGAKQQQNAYRLMEAIYRKEPCHIHSCLSERAELRSVIPPEGQRYELLQPLDLVALGLVRLCRHRDLSVALDHSHLPLDILDVCASQRLQHEEASRNKQPLRS